MRVEELLEKICGSTKVYVYDNDGTTYVDNVAVKYLDDVKKDTDLMRSLVVDWSVTNGKLEIEIEYKKNIYEISSGIDLLYSVSLIENRRLPVYVCCQGYSNYNFKEGKRWEDSPTYLILNDDKIFIADSCGYMEYWK